VALKLNEKQKRFAAEYLIDLNASAAARRAGYSKKTAGAQAHKLLKNAEIQGEIQRNMQKRAARTEVTQERVVNELARIGFSDLREVADWDESGQQWKSSDELTDDAAASIKDIKFTTERRRDRNGDTIDTVNAHMAMHDKRGALELLGRHLGIFKDNVNISTDEPLTIRVRGIRGPYSDSSDSGEPGEASEAE